MTKEFYNTVYQVDHHSKYGDLELLSRGTERLLNDTHEWLAATGLAGRSEALILEIGCGMACLANVHPGWHGAEYSKTAVDRVKAIQGDTVKIFEADAQQLPFENATYDGVFTWAALEHVPDPDKALIEIDRVLRGGGYALIAPAWNCRSWTVKKMLDRPDRELNWRERVGKALIPMRESIFFRALVALPGRIFDELRLLLGKPMRLRYRTLHPRWDLIDLYGHVADDDAVADIDPHAAICFFISRGYQVLSHATLLDRLLVRSGPVCVRKP